MNCYIIEKIFYCNVEFSDELWNWVLLKYQPCKMYIGQELDEDALALIAVSLVSGIYSLLSLFVNVCLL